MKRPFNQKVTFLLPLFKFHTLPSNGSYFPSRRYFTYLPTFFTLTSDKEFKRLIFEPDFPALVNELELEDINVEPDNNFEDDIFEYDDDNREDETVGEEPDGQLPSTGPIQGRKKTYLWSWNPFERNRQSYTYKSQSICQKAKAETVNTPLES